MCRWRRFSQLKVDDRGSLLGTISLQNVPTPLNIHWACWFHFPLVIRVGVLLTKRGKTERKGRKETGAGGERVPDVLGQNLKREKEEGTEDGCSAVSGAELKEIQRKGGEARIPGAGEERQKEGVLHFSPFLPQPPGGTADQHSFLGN